MKMIVFIHIPKTAGTSVYSIFSSIFGSINSLQVNNDMTVARLKNNMKSSLDSFSFFYGHYTYKILSYKEKSDFAFSFFRDPIQRYLSAIFFYLNQRADAKIFYEKINDTIKANVLNSYNSRSDNLQTRYFASIINEDFLLLDSRIYGDILIENALMGMAEIDYIGLTENFDLSIYNICRMNNIHVPFFSYYPKSNKSEKYKISEVKDVTINSIKEINKLDIVLHKYIKEKFFSTKDSFITNNSIEFINFIRKNNNISNELNVRINNMSYRNIVDNTIGNVYRSEQRLFLSFSINKKLVTIDEIELILITENKTFHYEAFLSSSVLNILSELDDYYVFSDSIPLSFFGNGNNTIYLALKRTDICLTSNFLNFNLKD